MDQLLDLITRQQGLNFLPGEQFLYSNSGYLLLSQVVSRVSGRSLRDFARDRIFAPLGMKSTVFWDDPGQIIPDRALAYSAQDVEGYRLEMWNLPFAGPAGLYTTVGDLALWDANFYNNKLGGGDNATELGTMEAGRFFMAGVGIPVTVEFHHSAGLVTMIVTVEDQEALRFVPLPTPAAGVLAAYAGSYWSDELRRELLIEIAGDDILVAWAGQENRAVGRLVGADEALLRQFVPVPWDQQDTRLRFDRDDTGAIAGLSLSCNMVRGVRFERRPAASG